MFQISSTTLMHVFAALVALSLPALAADKSFVGSENPAWKQHVEWTLNQQLACHEAVDDVSPCNRFVGRALERVWGYKDFVRGSEYLLANDIVSQVLVMGDKWVEIGRANEQESLDASAQWANKGHAVIALSPGAPYGHVALVLPGPLSASAGWALKVPNSASFLFKRPEKSYVGKPLSFAFGPEKKQDVKLYYRKK